MKNTLSITAAILFCSFSANAGTFPLAKSGENYSLVTKIASCFGGRLLFEGQCMFKSELRSYCGPGYTPRGSKCVSMGSRGELQLGDGRYVTEAQCKRMGLIKDDIYCIEDD